VKDHGPTPLYERIKYTVTFFLILIMLGLLVVSMASRGGDDSAAGMASGGMPLTPQEVGK
jgi:hypothetical protein